MKINNNPIYKLEMDLGAILLNEYTIFSWHYELTQNYECDICNIHINQKIRFHMGICFGEPRTRSNIKICINCYKKLHILATARTI